MNIELLTQIRDWLAAGAPETKQGFGFDMATWIEAEPTATGWCGTACCIAGAALVFGDPETVTVTLDEMADPSFGQIFWSYRVDNLAADLLGLDSRTADQLFCPWDYGMPERYNPTPTHAAEVITRLIETGEVKW